MSSMLLGHNARATHASVSVFTMKILLYFAMAAPDPSTKTLTTGAQRSDFIA